MVVHRAAMVMVAVAAVAAAAIARLALVEARPAMVLWEVLALEAVALVALVALVAATTEERIRNSEARAERTDWSLQERGEGSRQRRPWTMQRCWTEGVPPVGE